MSKYNISRQLNILLLYNSMRRKCINTDKNCGAISVFYSDISGNNLKMVGAFGNGSVASSAKTVTL
jgi:hypothetical protein